MLIEEVAFGWESLLVIDVIEADLRRYERGFTRIETCWLNEVFL